ncbi:AI-2E family transporter [Halogeometricum luteum]|uniref:AI-2E family transporter n=1 Tax=Halogeometricum luteum TaxID=2950537 RepID=A0ABU2FZW9_9EURY|nr:AI-2E family transporter [Halogeometricum sp. S3BR5-2]MDS0293781.1 AI-2E family transporter [Halogeometricum sp. S3BR5-2]
MNEGDSSSSRSFLQVLLAVLGTLTVVLVVPFLQAVLLGGLMAYLVAPVNDRLSRRLGATAGAAATMLATTVVVLAPLLFVLAVAVDQAVALARGAELPDVAALESFLSERFGTSVPGAEMLVEPLGNAVEAGLRGLVGSVGGILGGVSTVLVGAVIFLFAFFVLLRDGDRFVAWIRAVTPLDAATTDELFARTDDLLWAAVVGNVVVAGLQAILTVVGFAVVGFDNVVFWGVATFLLSLLPVIGASIVWIPAVGYLLFVGNVPAAVGLFLYGSFVISGSDNVVRPMAMRRGARLNSGVLVLSIFGGVAVFGFLGIFVGPVVFGLTKTVIELLAEERADPRGS